MVSSLIPRATCGKWRGTLRSRWLQTAVSSCPTKHHVAEIQTFRKGITREVRRIHLRKPDLGVSKLPIAPIRAQRVSINRLDKPKELTCPHRSRGVHGR